MEPQAEHWGEQGLSIFLGAIRRLAPACIIMVVLGIVPLAVYGWSAPGGFARVTGSGAMAGAAAFVAGGLVGFLFGIPRALRADAEPSNDRSEGRRPEYRVNTNLEQISDWLTKILVGVGLTQIPTIGDAGGRLIARVAKSMGDEPSATGVAGAVLVYFLGNGFLWAYFLTRTALTRMFAVSDTEMSHLNERIRQIEKASKDTHELSEQIAREVHTLTRGERLPTAGPGSAGLKEQDTTRTGRSRPAQASP